MTIRLRRHSAVSRVDVIGDEIRVSLSDSNYTCYFKPDHSPQLLARQIPNRDDTRLPISLSEFLIRAWRAANSKAKELGWTNRSPGTSLRVTYRRDGPHMLVAGEPLFGPRWF